MIISTCYDSSCQFHFGSQHAVSLANNTANGREIRSTVSVRSPSRRACTRVHSPDRSRLPVLAWVNDIKLHGLLKMTAFERLQRTPVQRSLLDFCYIDLLHGERYHTHLLL